MVKLQVLMFSFEGKSRYGMPSYVANFLALLKTDSIMSCNNS